MIIIRLEINNPLYTICLRKTYLWPFHKKEFNFSPRVDLMLSKARE